MRRLLAALAFAGTLVAQPDPVDNIRKLAAQGRFPQAEAAARVLVAQIDERDHGKDSEELSEALRTLVSTFIHSPKVKDPEEDAIAERALAVSQRVFTPSDLPYIRTRHEVAKFLNKDGDFVRARDMLDQVLAMYEKLRRDTPNPDQETREGMLREIALGWNNYALILKDMDDYAGAKSGFEHALALHRERGREDRELAVSLNNLASV